MVLLWCAVLGKLGPQASSCRLVYTAGSNKFCSTVTHIVHHKTCSVTTHAQSHLWQPRESVVGLIYVPSLLVVVAVVKAMLFRFSGKRVNEAELRD